MSWTWSNPAMLLGLLALAIPVVIHLLNRRRNVVIDWGAMQFLDVGRRARQKIRLTDSLLMAARMLVLALVALALARPLLVPRQPAPSAATAAGGASTARRDVVLLIDNSASMGRKDGTTTLDARARDWAAELVKGLPSGSTVALIQARERPRAVVAPLSFDRARTEQAIRKLPPPAGASDLPAALVEALQLLERGENTARDIVVLSDRQAQAWRTDEATRWQLLRELHRESARKSGVEPRLWCVALEPGSRIETGADGGLAPLELPRGIVPPRLPVEVRTTVQNAGPGMLTRTAELLVDGVPLSGQAQAVGPLPQGGKSPLVFRVSLDEPGSHLLSVRLTSGDDPFPANDSAELPVSVVSALPVLLVDGDRGLVPLSSETDFLRAALQPTSDETPPIEATVIEPDQLTRERLEGQKVLVLANVPRLPTRAVDAIRRFLDEGGGLLVAPGDRVDAETMNAWGSGWMPATLEKWRGEPGGRVVVAHPASASFQGPVLAPLAQGDDPPLASAVMFGYWMLEPVATPPAAAILARFDTGDPWIVERPHRRGRVVILAGPVDAAGGTLPVNPDFVPLAHELVYQLADPGAAGTTVRVGQPIEVALGASAGSNVASVAVTTPAEKVVTAKVERTAGGSRARLEEAEDPGTYKFALPDGPAFVTALADPREADLAPLDPAARSSLARGWPLEFADAPEALQGRLLATPGGRTRHLWRGLILAALAGLCVEVYLTRRIVRERGLAEIGTDD